MGNNRILAVAALSLASLAVRLLPFRLLARAAGWGQARSITGALDLEVARVLARSIAIASCRVPWRTVCLQEGLALQWLLRRSGYPSVLHYGIGPGHDQLSAHVWVSLGGTILIGEREAGTHAQVATFPAAM